MNRHCPGRKRKLLHQQPSARVPVIQGRRAKRQAQDRAETPNILSPRDGETDESDNRFVDVCIPLGLRAGSTPLSAESKRQSRQWLRVGLKLDSQLTTTTEKQIRDLFTRQLRQLGDVEAVPLLTDHYPLDSNEVHDVKLRYWFLEAAFKNYLNS